MFFFIDLGFFFLTEDIQKNPKTHQKKAGKKEISKG